MSAWAKKPNQERDQLIAKAYSSGKTLNEVGLEFGITRERVRQVVSGLGIDKLSGGKAISSFLSVRSKSEANAKSLAGREEKCMAKWGISLDQYRALVAEFGSTTSLNSPIRKFMTQRTNAKIRGIEWQFTFSDWFRVWQESGHWEQRGRGTGYVMARYGDDGPYCEANVYICTSGQNFSDSYLVHSAESRNAKRIANGNGGRGTGRGWRYAPQQSKKNPYVVQAGRKYIGAFPTEESARAAYLEACAKAALTRRAT